MMHHSIGSGIPILFIVVIIVATSLSDVGVGGSDSSLTTLKSSKAAKHILRSSVAARKELHQESKAFRVPSKKDFSQFVFRPKPSDKRLPVLPLKEIPDPASDPTSQDLEPGPLLQLLGVQFERSFMSVARPPSDILYPNGSLYFPFRLDQKQRILPKPGQSIPRQLKRRFQRKGRLPYGVRVRMHVAQRYRRRFLNYIWAYTTCPVLRKWRHLGTRFWPRWILEGQCYNANSCSIPPGMSCHPENQKYLSLLRWHCKYWGGKVSYCSWIKIRYPILTSCKCGCPPIEGPG